MKLPQFISNNLILKITSVNSAVVSIRLVISLVTQRLLASYFGEAGIASIGSLRNILAILNSLTLFGTSSGIIKYVSEFKKKPHELNKVFSATWLFMFLGILLTTVVFFFWAKDLSIQFFQTKDYSYLFKLLIAIIPFIAINRWFRAILNGLSDYKRYAKIELITYFLGVILLVISIFYFDFKAVIISIILVPVIELIVVGFFFKKQIKRYFAFNVPKLNFKYVKTMLGFAIMGFVSTFFANYIELDIRAMVIKKISINEAGNWTALTNISKNYMAFSAGLFSLYVLPRFSRIYELKTFKKEVKHIYINILPIFAFGMLMVYIFRNLIVQLIYPDFTGMEPLFKWQLLADFTSLCSTIISYQFLAKKMVKSYVTTELLSLIFFYILSSYLITFYGAEGIVIANLIRYIIYFIVVTFVIWQYFKKQQNNNLTA